MGLWSKKGPDEDKKPAAPVAGPPVPHVAEDSHPSEPTETVPRPPQKVEAILQPENEFERETHRYTRGKTKIKQIVRLPGKKLLITRWGCQKPTIYKEDGTIERVAGLFDFEKDPEEDGNSHTIVTREQDGATKIHLHHQYSENVRRSIHRDISITEEGGIKLAGKDSESAPYHCLSYDNIILNQAPDRISPWIIPNGEIRFIAKDGLQKSIIDSNTGQPIKVDIETLTYSPEAGEIYWSVSSSGGEIAIVDVTKAVNEWHVETVKPESQTTSISGVTGEPRKNYLIVAGERYSSETHMQQKGVFIINRKTGKIETEVVGDFAGAPHYLDGDIFINSPDNTLRRISTNLHTIISAEEIEKQRAKMAKIRRLGERAAAAKEEAPAKFAAITVEIGAKQKEILADINAELQKTNTREDAETLLRQLQAHLEETAAETNDRELTEEIFKPAKEKVEAKIAEFLSTEIGATIQEIRGKLGTGMSIAGVDIVGKRLASLQGHKSDKRITPAQRAEIVSLEEAFERETETIFQEQEKELLETIDGKMKSIQEELEKIDSHPAFEDWADSDFPSYLQTLEQYRSRCPLRNKAALSRIEESIRTLMRLKEVHEKKFLKEYAKIRTIAQETTDQQAKTIQDTITSFAAALNKKISEKKFAAEAEAEEWVKQNQTYATIINLIDLLRNRNKDLAESLSDRLETEVQNAIYRIERLSQTEIDAETGQQYELFGDFLFPKWEGRTEKKKPVRIELKFEVDAKTIGPGVPRENYMGHLYYEVTDDHGEKRRYRVFEEDERQYGLVGKSEVETIRGHVSAREARKFLSGYSQWQNEKSELRQKYETIVTERAKIMEELRKAQKASDTERTGQLKAEYKAKCGEYIKFVTETGVWLYRRLDMKRKQNELEKQNGKGLVPERSTHWVRSPYTERVLQKIAEDAKMQLDNKEGTVMLVGHAGTGKDVLIKMFCNKTNRPYYRFDCSKWTTEADLGEDLILESKEGASRTIKVPSMIVKGIQTPGAVVYLNEFNAMPEPAQIFLHALFDESRSMTLKTRGGETVEAHPSVVFMGSMNPNYVGTFQPQYATLSRFCETFVEYPPLKDKSDNFDPSEALMVARSTRSLAGLSRSPNMEKNEFVKLWNTYVNRQGEVDRTALTPEREFDLNVITGLVQFGNKLREGFITMVEKREKGRKALQVPQPFTLREMRRCAYRLSQMKPEDKKLENAEETARQLIRRYFLSHIFDQKKVEEIDTALRTWTVERKLAQAA